MTVGPTPRGSVWPEMLKRGFENFCPGLLDVRMDNIPTASLRTEANPTVRGFPNLYTAGDTRAETKWQVIHLFWEGFRNEFSFFVLLGGLSLDSA